MCRCTFPVRRKLNHRKRVEMNIFIWDYLCASVWPPSKSPITSQIFRNSICFRRLCEHRVFCGTQERGWFASDLTLELGRRSLEAKMTLRMEYSLFSHLVPEIWGKLRAFIKQRLGQSLPDHAGREHWWHVGQKHVRIGSTNTLNKVKILLLHSVQ